jgi:uncharacterized protein DUF6504
VQLLHERREEPLPNTNVSEIHAYPLRPTGFQEPLFPTADSKRAVVEHLLKAPWLTRASQLKGRSGEVAHTPEEPVKLKGRRGRVELLRTRSGRCYWRRRAVVRVLDRWRDRRDWWDEEQYTDRFVFRVLLSGGAVVDLARERSGGWLLVGVVD